MEFNLGILIFGIFLLAIGLIVLAAQMKSKSRNTEPTTARVTSYFISVDIDPDSKSEYPSYFPIVKYQVHG